MKKQRLTIQINRPAPEVFAFTINPENTPLWTDFIFEETNVWPIRIGATYKNKAKSTDPWSKYTLTRYIKNKSFTMIKDKSRYHVRYRFIPVGKNATLLEYYEWVEKGELEEPFNLETLERLKSILESKS
jgi:hypothetical protein